MTAAPAVNPVAYRFVTDWRAAGAPASVLTPDGWLVPVNLRATANRQHLYVFDLLRSDRGALCGCLECGHTWPEGTGTLPPCTP
jgi:hypothetical protein